MKKITALFIALVMAVSSVFCVSFNAFAEDAQISTAELNTEYSVSLKQGDVISYYFTPEESGTYIIESFENDGDPYGYLYVDGEDDYLYKNDDGGEGSNFKIAFALEAGTRYIIKCSSFELDKASYKFSIVKSTVTLISFTPANAYTLTEGVDSYTDEDENGNKYSVYNLPSIYGSGNKLTVYYSDKDAQTFTYGFCENEERYCFINDNDSSDTLSGSSVSTSSHQGVGNEWKLGTNYFTVSYMGVSCNVPVTIVENRVNSIEFIPAKPYVLKEGVDGYNQDIYDDEDNITGSYFYYEYNGIYEVGNKLIVHYKDTDKADEYVYSYVESEDDYYFVNSNDSTDIIHSHLNYYGNQYNKHWSLGNDNSFTVEYMGVRCNVPVSIIENDVSSVRFVPVKPYVLTEAISDGYYDEDYDENDEYIGSYYRFDLPELNEIGNKIYVSYSDGTPDAVYTYSYKENINGYSYYNDADENDYFEFNEIRTTHNQWEQHWVAGGEYSFTGRIFGREFTVPVTIKANPVESIQFIPNNPYELVEETSDGEYENEYDDDDNVIGSYYRYYYSIRNYGDKLIVNKNGTSVTYTYGYSEELDESCYINDDDSSDYIDRNNISYDDEQYTNHWAVGKDNYFTVKYAGKTYNVPVTVKENNIESIEYIPASPRTVYENTDGRFETDDMGEEYYDYNYTSTSTGDKLVLHLKDNTTETYTLEYSDELEDSLFINDSDKTKTIEENEVNVEANQWKNHWKLGTNYVTVRYMGCEYQLEYTVLENPVESIEFVPAKEIVFTENTGGYYQDDEDSGEFYYYSNYGVNYDDKLIINGKDGTVKTYVYRSHQVDDYWSSDFINEADENDILMYDVWSIGSDQYSNHWTVGSDNYFYITCFGKECAVPVTIVSNPVDSIHLDLAEPFSSTENTNGYYNTDGDGSKYYYYEISFYNIPLGSKLTVNYTDREPSVYTFKWLEDDEHMDYYFVNDNDETDLISNLGVDNNQYQNHWTVGTNYFKVSYMGKSEEIPYTVTASPIESINYIPAQAYTVVENTDGYYSAYEDEFYYYNYDAYCKLGDKLSVVYTDKTEKSYTYKQVEVDGWSSDRFVNDADENDILESSDYNFTNRQYSEHWSVGSDNYVYFSYLGRECAIPVTVTANPVKSFEYIPANAYVFTVNDPESGYESYDWDGNKFFRYNVSVNKIGDKLVVNYKDNTTAAYTCKYDENTGKNVYVNDKDSSDIIDSDKIKNNIYDSQSEKPWVLGSENSFKAVYMGAECSVPVVITEEGHTHSPADAVRENEQVSSCTAGGSYDEVVYCSICGAELSRENVTVEPSEHTASESVKENEVPATCLAGGSYDEVVYCSVCGEEMSRTPVNTEKADHAPKPAVKENEVPATCLAGGSYDEVVYCSVCNEELSRTPVNTGKADHTPKPAVKENEVPATCLAGGSYDEVVYCSVCNEELSRNAVTTGKSAHKPSEAVIENEVPATCSRNGSYDNVVYCSVCNEEISRNTVLTDKLSHTPKAAVKENEKQPTCTEAGSYENVVYCSVCNQVISRTKVETEAATGHSWGEWVSNNDATAQKDGTKTRVCSVCKTKETVTDEGSKLPPSESDTPSDTVPSGENDSKTDGTPSKPAGNTPAKTTPVADVIKLTLKKIKVKKSAKKLVLQATLKVNGKAVKGKKVTFKFNGKKYKAKTNKKGVAKVTIKKKVLKKLKVGKKVKYSVTYGKKTVSKSVKVKK